MNKNIRRTETMKKSARFLALALAAVMLLALCACGGGGDQHASRFHHSR